jgi:hypothetical protein
MHWSGMAFIVMTYIFNFIFILFNIAPSSSEYVECNFEVSSKWWMWRMWKEAVVANLIIIPVFFWKKWENYEKCHLL